MDYIVAIVVFLIVMGGLHNVVKGVDTSSGKYFKLLMTHSVVLAFITAGVATILYDMKFHA